MTRIQDNKVYLQELPSQAGGVDWAPRDGATVTGGNYGEIQNVTLLNDVLKVETSLGTLKFSGVALDPAVQEFSSQDLLATDERLNNLTEGFNFLEVMYLLFETAKERKEVEREVRHISREQAEAQALNAADEIRSGALANMIFGVVSGGINIVSGAVSLGMSVKSFGGLKSEAQNLKMAKTESRMANVEAELRQTNVDIAKTRTQMKGMDPNSGEYKKLDVQLKTLEGRSAELKQLHETQLKDLDVELEKAQTNLKDAESTYQERSADAKQDGNAAVNKIRQSRLSAAENNLDLAQQKVTALKGMKVEADAFSNAPDPKTIKADDLKALEGVQAKAAAWQLAADGRLQTAHQRFSGQLTLIQNEVQLAQSVGQVGQGAAGISTAVGGYMEQQGQASAKESDAAAERARTHADDAKNDMQSAQEIIADVIKFFESVKQSQAEVMSAIARGFAP